MSETRRNSLGDVLPPRQPDPRTYCERQAPNAVAVCVRCGREAHARVMWPQMRWAQAWVCSRCAR
jgi:hypothetical protein